MCLALLLPIHPPSQTDVDRNTTNGDNAIESIVLAANKLLRATRAATSANSDGGAGKTDRDVNVLQDDT